MFHQIRAFRETKPLFTMDFWNDGQYVNGCVAGGKDYLHINANGDIEPCAFIHYSDSNIREKTLLEAFKSPLFMSLSPFHFLNLVSVSRVKPPDIESRVQRPKRSFS